MEDESEFIFTDFSYSGVHEIGGINRTVFNGERAFADEEAEFRFLPDFFFGAESLCLPNADRNYKALDLIHVTINKDADIFIAHDLLLPTPGWLEEDYQKTDVKIILNGRGHELFKKTVKAGTTLTMGGNMDEQSTTEGNMYLVFATEVAADANFKDPFINRKIDWKNLPKWG